MSHVWEIALPSSACGLKLICTSLLQLTDCAIRDYNRGRDYLCDLANRDGIPLFEDITEAVNCAISILNSIPNEVNHM